MPKSMAIGGRRARRFFNRAGQLRRIQGLNFWPLKKVLMEKYKFNEVEATSFSEFLEPMLAWDPDYRASAQTALSHPWLTMKENYETRMTTEEFQRYQMRNKEKEQPTSLEYNGDASTEYYYNVEMAKLTDSETELLPADDEWAPGPKGTQQLNKQKEDKLQDFFDNGFDDKEDFFFTDE